jgi:hypothetical protein
MIAAGGIGTAGGFTKLFNELENPNANTCYDVTLEFPDDWAEQDVKKVSDRIVDMDPRGEEIVNGVYVYTVRLYFVYEDDKWADPESGILFYVPSADHGGGVIDVRHGLFWVDASWTENIAANYDIGDVITLKTVLVYNGDVLSFGNWLVVD